MSDIRDCLKVAVADSGMKQIAIARKANISPSKLSDIVNKRRRMDVNEMVEICKAINITPESLFTAS